MQTMQDIFEFIDYIPKKKPDGVRLRYTTAGPGPSGEVIVLVNGDTTWAWWAEPARSDPKRHLKYSQSNFLDGARGFAGKDIGEMHAAFREAATGAYRDSGGNAQAVLKAIQSIVGRDRRSHWSLAKEE